MEVKDVTPETLYGALFACGGYPYRLEDTEDIECVQKLFDVGCCLIEVLPGNDDFVDICVKLDLIPDNKPQRVYIVDMGYNQECGYIAFEDDWEPIFGDIPDDILAAWSLRD